MKSKMLDQFKEAETILARSAAMFKIKQERESRKGKIKFRKGAFKN